MYIVKLSEDRCDERYNGLPNILDAYHETDTLEEALELRGKWINEYPFLVKVEIFKSDRIEINDDVQEKARQRKEDYYRKVEKYKSLGFEGYKEIDENGNIVFEF